MIRYSSYGSSNYRAAIPYLTARDSLAVEYGKLLELRERVRKAEAESPSGLTVKERECSKVRRRADFR
jgi:hypothetical protein